MNPELKKAKKIIIIDLLYLGDLIFVTPFLRNLRNNLPDKQIDMIVNSNFTGIMEDNPYIDNIFSYNKRWSIKESIQFAKEIKKRDYDLGLNIHGSWRTVILLKLIDPTYSIGFAEGGRGIFLDERFKPNEDIHMVDMYLEFLGKLGINRIDDLGLEMNIKQEIRRSMAQFLEKQGIKEDEKLIGLNTGGSYETKKWPIEYFAKLADRLQEDYKKRVIFFGSPGDVERVNKIIKLMKSKPVIATGKTSLKELVALAERCELFISGDTGPLHVAASVGISTIAIFGPTDEKQFYPYGKGHQIVKLDNLDCRPCGKHVCPHKHHDCLRKIKVEDILESVRLFFEGGANEKNNYT